MAQRAHQVAPESAAVLRARSSGRPDATSGARTHRLLRVRGRAPRLADQKRAPALDFLREPGIRQAGSGGSRLPPVIAYHPGRRCGL